MGDKNGDNGAFLTDATGCPVLNENQKQIVIELFKEGPSYVNALAEKTALKQQTVSAIIKRLEEGKIVFFDDYDKPSDRGAPRKIFSLTGAGFFAAIVCVLGEVSDVDETLATLAKGIDNYSGKTLEKVDLCEFFVLEKWNEIIRRSSEHPPGDQPADWMLSTSHIADLIMAPGMYRYKELLKKPEGLWLAALDYAAKRSYFFVNTYGQYYRTGYSLDFDEYFTGFLVNGATKAGVFPDLWFGYIDRVIGEIEGLNGLVLEQLNRRMYEMEFLLSCYQAAIERFDKKID